MRRPLRASPSTINKSQPYALPPPVGGWNARDALATMPATDAERLDNWFPDTTFVGPRAGSLTYATGFPGTVKTMIQWAGGTTVRLLVGASGRLFSTSTSGSAGYSTISSGFTVDEWQGLNFGAGGGNYLMLVNGANTLQAFNGTSSSIQNITCTDGTLTSAFTNINEYQQRLYFTKSQSLSFYYMQAANAISGTAAPFDLSGILALGGELAAMGSWTRDNGDGMDDMAVFITTQGQAAVYQGTDPSSATTWSLVGVYRIPKPIGRRCVAKYGGDLVILTTDGVLPMSSVVGGPVQEKSFITDKIRPAFTAAYALYRNNSGWQLKYLPDSNWLLVNVPVSISTQQFVMNTTTGAWCRFSGMNAYCWESFQNRPMFGTSTKIIEANTGTNDDGADIAVDAKQAPSVFGLPGQKKKFNLFRPHLKSNGDIPLAVAINIDFADDPPTNFPSPLPVNYPIWDVATWDNFFWADSPQVSSTWYSAGGYGTYGAVRLKGAVNTEEIQWFGTDVAFEGGGLI